MTKLNPKDWQYWGQWVQPTLHGNLWMHWGEANALKPLRTRLTSNLFLSDGHFFWWKKDYQLLFKKARQSVQKENWQFFRELEESSQKAKAMMLKVEREVLSGQNDIATTINQFLDAFLELVGPWSAIFPVGAGIEEELNILVKKSGHDLSEYVSLFQPSKKPWVAKQHEEILEFLKLFKKQRLLSLLDLSIIKVRRKLQKQNPKLLSRIEQHIRQYSWVGTHHFWGKGFTFKNLVQSMQNILKSKVKTHETLSTPQLPSKAYRPIRFLKSFTYWRLHLAEVSDLVSFFLRPLFRDVEKKLGLEKDDLYWLTIHEIKDGLAEEKAVPSKSELKKRKQLYGIIHLNSKETVITGSQASSYLKKVEAKQITSSDTTELKGMPGCKGTVKGRVRIVKDPSSAVKFRRGEIIVSPETTPDFIPAMRIAAAIITDIGGITSHAAIVARELNTPCIIGTKIATKILKDGDLVEVDANKGVIKKL